MLRKVLTSVLVCVTIFGSAGCSSDKISRYMEVNRSALDLANPDLSLLQTGLEGAEVILGGEYHAVKANYDVRFSLLTALHQQEGFKYLLCEMGHGTAGLLNLYLETGDPAIPDRIMRALKGSGSWSLEFSEFWQRLYEYNQQQPEDKRIIAVGTDIDWQVGPAMDYLFTLPGTKQLPLLENAYDVQSEDFPDYIHSVQEDMEVNPEVYTRALGDKLFDFEMVINNLATLVAYHENQEQGMRIREQAMYDNFVKLYNHYPRGRYFGQFGMAHVYQKQCSDGMEGVERFAMALNRDDSPVRGRVLSIAYMYIDSKMLSWQNNFTVIEVENQFTDTAPVRKTALSDFTLFRLTGDDSPFSKQPHMISGPYGGVTTDYFQYILAIRNSRAATPYGPTE